MSSCCTQYNVISNPGSKLTLLRLIEFTAPAKTHMRSNTDTNPLFELYNYLYESSIIILYNIKPNDHFQQIITTTPSDIYIISRLGDFRT